MIALVHGLHAGSVFENDTHVGVRPKFLQDPGHRRYGEEKDRVGSA